MVILCGAAFWFERWCYVINNNDVSLLSSLMCHRVGLVYYDALCVLVCGLVGVVVVGWHRVDAIRDAHLLHAKEQHSIRILLLRTQNITFLQGPARCVLLCHVQKTFKDERNTKQTNKKRRHKCVRCKCVLYVCLFDWCLPDE